MMSVTSALLASIPGVIHGFGTRESPLPFQKELNWDTQQPRWKQVHGNAVAIVRGPAQECGEVDALLTWDAGVPIAVITADCVPVLMAHREGKAVACAHAGWRGTRARILHSVWDELAANGHRPEEWVAAIGPSIGPCCYEVSEELIADFEKTFPRLDAALIAPRHRMLDLQAINEATLRDIGFKTVDRMGFCTRCSSSPPFFSYRREGKGTRQWSVIALATQLRGTSS